MISRLIIGVLCFGVVLSVSAGDYKVSSRWKGHFAGLAKREAKNGMPPEGAVLCIGSSSMRGWHYRIAKDLAPLTVIPRGFGGSNMNDVLQFVETGVIRYKPRAIMIYEGDNDCAARVDPEKINQCLKDVVAKVHAKLPKTRFYILAVKPSISRWRIWPQMQATNKLFEETCKANELMTYIDIATPMLGEDGKPKPEIFKKDKLHMNNLGYDIWAAVVKPILHKGELEYEKK